LLLLAITASGWVVPTTAVPDAASFTVVTKPEEVLLYAEFVVVVVFDATNTERLSVSAYETPAPEKTFILRIPAPPLVIATLELFDESCTPHNCVAPPIAAVEVTKQ
jgi:hypothetical protein